MNKKRRQEIVSAIELINEASAIIDCCKDNEEDALYNLEGTSLECTERYENIESSCKYLCRALDKLESTKDELQSAMYP